ncbi:glycosyltransferase [Marinobacter sp.]|uniref:glycosyltransferase n=1 Tax=Marinobacter sp. TaxID=50741 RepID=UPI003A8D7F9A
MIFKNDDEAVLPDKGKKKLLVVYNKVWPYRVCIFNILSEKFDLTVAVNDRTSLSQSYNFKVVYLETKKVGPFQWHRNNLRKIMNSFDCVVGLYDIRWLRFMLASLFSKSPVIFWGIGVTASYENKFDSKSTWDRVRLFFAKRSRGVLLYSDYPVERHIRLGMPKDRIWVAHNTTNVSLDSYDEKCERCSILFVGSLYKEKNVMGLLGDYRKAVNVSGSIPKLEVIGSGEDFEMAKKFVIDNELSDKVVMHGAIYNPQDLVSIFNRGIVCISPSQAGLSVLTSMGMGVPFATNSDAITGGEIFNIRHLETGVFIDKLAEDTTSFFLWVEKNHEDLLYMGIKARDFYLSYRRPEITSDIISQAVESAIKCS